MLPLVGKARETPYLQLIRRSLPPHRTPPDATQRPAFLPESYTLSAAETAREGPDTGRVAEKLLTLLGVPILLVIVSAVSTTLWNDRATNATRDAVLSSMAERIDGVRLRQREDVDGINRAMAEAIRRGEQARAELARTMADRDAEQSKQLAEQAVVLNQFRVQASVLNEQVTGMRGDLQEIKAILQQRPPPARAIDRLPPSGWSAPR